MGIEIPGALEWLAENVVGANWPEGDETALRRLGEAWQQAGVDVGEVIEQGEAAASALLATMQGQAAEAFNQYWGQFTREGEQYLVKLQQLCDELGASCGNTALEIEYTKLTTIAALVALAAEIAALTAAAFGTFGASTAGIPVAMAATRTAVAMLFRQLIAAILRELAITVGTDVAIQGLQVARGDRDSWDRFKTGQAAVSGAISGTVSGGFGAIPQGTSRSFGDAFAQGAARGGAEGVTATAAEAAVTGRDISAGDLTRGATSGAVSGGIGGATRRAEGLSGLADQSTPGSAPTAGETGGGSAGAPASRGPGPAPDVSHSGSIRSALDSPTSTSSSTSGIRSALEGHTPVTPTPDISPSSAATPVGTAGRVAAPPAAAEPAPPVPGAG